MSDKPPRVVVLSGATRGLGRALVDRLAREPELRIFGCGRDPDRVAELARRHPRPHAFRVVDVADDAAVARWADEVAELAEAPPDLLVANAALMNPVAPLWEIPPEAFDPVVDVNVKGVANMIRRFLPPMVARRRGVVVALSSYWGRSVSSGVAPYCATKWAVEGMMRALAQDLPPGMAAVPLNPGVIDTDMLRSCFGPAAAAHVKPDAWARAAADFLLALSPRDNGKPLTVPGQ